MWKNSKKCNKDTRSASESPPNYKLWDMGEHLGDVSLYICPQVMLFACCYQPLLETGCWAPRALGVTQHSCSSPVSIHFLLGGGRKKQQTPSSQCQREHLSLDWVLSHSWLCMIRERYFAQNEIGQRLESGHFSLDANTSMHPSYFSSEKF